MGKVSLGNVSIGSEQLVCEQRKDPELSALFESAVSAEESMAVSRGYFVGWRRTLLNPLKQWFRGGYRTQKC